MTIPFSKKGFTLIELLVVISILAILLILALTHFNKERLKAEDTRRKSDLFTLKIAFENYYNDNSCYPPSTWFDSKDDCGSNQFAPYLNSIPCDPSTGSPYVLETDPTTCGWFKLYATFSLPDYDSQAVNQRSPTGSTSGNFGVSSSNVVVSVLYQSSPATPITSSPTPTPIPSILPSPLPQNHEYYWCSNIGNCTNFDETRYVCTPYYTDNPNCDGGINKCASVGSCIQL